MSHRKYDAAPIWIVAVDVVMINLAMAIGYVLRYRLQWFADVVYSAPFSAYTLFNVFFSLSVPLLLWADHAYSDWRGRTWVDHVYRILTAVTFAVVMAMALAFILRPLVYSRLLLLEAGLVMTVLLSLDRAGVMLLETWLRRRGVGVRRVVIVGAGEVGRRVMRTIVARPDLGYEIVGYMDDNPVKGEGEIGRFKGLGPVDNLATIIDTEAVDEVIITLPWNYQRRIFSILRACELRQVEPRMVPDLFQMSLSRVDVSDLGGVPLIRIREIAFSREALIFKRAVDLAGAIWGMVLGAPIFGLIALAIRLDTPGPIFFRQERVGKDGHHFEILKFRSMRRGAEEEQSHLELLNEADGPIFKIRDDPRTTRVGHFLRRTSLDELPQLWNVLKGEMSLVGPRPPMPAEVEQYQPWHKKRLAVPPGMTGLWQVSGRSELTFDEMVLLDLYYIEHWSPWMDVAILLRTIPKVLLGDGAY